MVDVGAARSRHLLPELAGREFLGDGEGDIAQDRQDQDLRAADMIERLPHEEIVAVLQVAHLLHTARGDLEHGLGNEHALGRPGGAGGEHDRREAHGPRHVISGPDGGGAGKIATVQHEDAFARLRLAGGKRGFELRIAYRDGGVHQADCMHQPVADERRVHRHPDHARAQKPMDESKRGGTVACHHGHRVTGAHAMVGKPGDHRVGGI